MRSHGFLRILFFVLSFALLAACSSESYRCVESTCYYCDGLGCRPIDSDGQDAGAILDGSFDAGELDGGGPDGSVDDGGPDDGGSDDAGLDDDGGSNDAGLDAGTDAGPAPFCSTDDQCAAGHPCRGGICRTPCETSADCLRYDVQFQRCVTGYCMATHESTAN